MSAVTDSCVAAVMMIGTLISLQGVASGRNGLVTIGLAAALMVILPVTSWLPLPS